MEEKKLDLNTIIGFVLIFGIIIWIMYKNTPTDAEIAAQKAQQEQVDKAKVKNDTKANVTQAAVIDSTGKDS